MGKQFQKNIHQVERSLLVTGFGYKHDDAWATNINLFEEFTDISRGMRRLGGAAVDMSHVALGIVEAYWEYRLKPWDMATGVLIVEEAGGVVIPIDGGSFLVFDRPEWMTPRHHQGRFTEEAGECCGGGLPHALQHSPFSSFFPCKQSIPMKTSKSEIISKSTDMV